MHDRADTRVRTADSGVGLDEHLALFFPEQHRLPQPQEVVSAAVADGGVALIESSASGHVCCGLQHLRNRWKQLNNLTAQQVV